MSRVEQALLILVLLAIVAAWLLARPADAEQQPDVVTPASMIHAWPTPSGTAQARSVEVPPALPPRSPPATPPRPDDTHVGVSEPSIAATTVTPAPSASSGSGSMAAGLRGVASWWNSWGHGLYAAAGPALRVGHWLGETVTVCSTDTGKCIPVPITTSCQCYGSRLIDLSLDTIYALGLSPSRGVFRVQVMAP